MIIPNGLTLVIQNKQHTTRKLGNAILNDKEIEHIHFRTTKELREAIRLQQQHEILIRGEVPQEVLDLLNHPEEDEDEKTEHPDAAGGLFYRDEFLPYQKKMGFAKLQVVAAAPEDAEIGEMWMIDPSATEDEGGTN